MKRTHKHYVWTNALFKLVPTILISAYLWSIYGTSVAVLKTNIESDILFFTGGLIASYFAYAYRLRFSVTFALLLAILYGVYSYLGAQAGGEFDSYYISVAFFRYSLFFVCGWLVGFGFARFPYFPWAAAVVVFVFGVWLLVGDFLGLQARSDSGLIRWAADKLMPRDDLLYRLFASIYLIFLPVIFYCIYIVSINEMLQKLTSFDASKVRYLVKRTLIFTAVITAIFLAPVIYVNLFGLPETLENQLQQAQVNSADFLKKTYNKNTRQPEFDLQTYSQLLPEVKLSDETVFCTYIDNFFDTETGEKNTIAGAYAALCAKSL